MVLPCKKTFVFVVSVWALFLRSLVTAQSPQGKTGIILDQDTFPSPTRLALKYEADRVSAAVDNLIPGQVGSYSTSDILCFVAPATWDNDPQGPPPITLVGTRRSGEPNAVHPHALRIALHRKVLQDGGEFIFELSHELAHVKMDARFDNYLIETFAVAVSLRALKELGFNQYRRDVIRLYINQLPASIRSTVVSIDDPQGWGKAVLKNVTTYWQREIQNQNPTLLGAWDFSFATLGALILEAYQQPVWSNLLGTAANSGQCVLSNGRPATPADAAEFKSCKPVILKMGKVGPALKALGYPLLRAK